MFDAKQPLEITITKSDIAGADRKHPESCAAARAICRATGAIEARVHVGRVYVRTNKGDWQRYRTPEGLRAEVVAFDRGGKFVPGTFVLSPIPPSWRTGKATGSKTSKSRKKSKGPIRPRHITTNVRTGPA